MSDKPPFKRGDIILYTGATTAKHHVNTPEAIGSVGVVVGTHESTSTTPGTILQIAWIVAFKESVREVWSDNCELLAEGLPCD